MYNNQNSHGGVGNDPMYRNNNQSNQSSSFTMNYNNNNNNNFLNNYISQHCNTSLKVVNHLLLVTVFLDLCLCYKTRHHYPYSSSSQQQHGDTTTGIVPNQIVKDIHRYNNGTTTSSSIPMLLL